MPARKFTLKDVTLTRKAAARRLGISPSAVLNLVAQRRLGCVPGSAGAQFTEADLLGGRCS